MPFGVEARARLAALPVAVMLPWQCSTLMASITAPPDADQSVQRVSADAPATATPALATGDATVTPAALSVEIAAPASAKREPPPVRVSGATPPPAPVRMTSLPDDVVIRVMNAGQPAFLRCWARAQRIDGFGAPKVRLHLEVDAAGRVTASTSDAESPALSRCLNVVARQLAFPAPGTPAVVDLPLIFQ